MDTLPTSVILRLYKAFFVAVVLTVLCTCLSGQKSSAPSQLYLLSATPTEHTDKTYPATLYCINADKKLKFVRQVVSEAEGVRVVQAWGEAIFVIHPHIESTRIAIVHTNGPEVVDDVVFNPHSLPLGDVWLATATPLPSSVDELVPLLTDATDPRSVKGTVAGISSKAAVSGSRLRTDAWDAYAALRREGSQGGPATVPYLLGSIMGDSLTISVYGHATVLDTIPVHLRTKMARIAPAIVVASQQYLVLEVQYAVEESASAKLPDWTEMFAHDRAQGLWKTIQVEGNASGCRLFGPWLATIVGMRNPSHKPGPGRENERGQETDRLPNVQVQYAIFAGKWIWSPGVLTLQNLADGRKIRIETGQEDSEILRVEGDVVLYRINDTIYQAKIVGDQLKDSTVIVKDEDVPEIHWVFWSK